MGEKSSYKGKFSEQKVGPNHHQLAAALLLDTYDSLNVRDNIFTL